MTHGTCIRLAAAAALLVGVGCASTRVKKDPGPHDRGMRYYLPKPYLLVERSEIPVDAEGKATRPSNNVVRIKLEYLPDFSEEYSVHIRAGVGKNATNLTVTDGWRLDKIDVNVDSKATEFLQAITKLIGTEPKLLQGPPKAAPLPGGSGPDPADAVPELTVEAHNVPLGYYEAVLGPGPGGGKRLHGWRYVGFAPFANCPLDGRGAAVLDCRAEELYGLVTVGNKIFFRKLSAVAQPKTVKTSDPPAAPVAPPPNPVGP